MSHPMLGALDPQSRWFTTFDTMARWAAVGLVASALMSRALFNLSALVLLVGLVLSGHYATRWAQIRQHPLTLPIALLIGLIVFGASYSPASPAQVIDHWERYSKFALVLLMIPLLSEERWRQRAWMGFVLAGLLTLASTYANIWWDVPWSRTQGQGWGVDHSVFANHIAQGLVMTFFCAYCLVSALHTRQRGLKAAWLVIAVLAAVSVTHLSIGRTGMAALGFVVTLVLLYELPAKWRWIGVAGAVVVIALLMASSSVLRMRFESVIQEIQAYQNTVDYTSSGARLHMWQVSWDLWWQSPLWGHGTGSYHDLAKAAFADATMCDIGCFHPHNQWLFFAVDYGLLGVAALGFLLWRLARIGCHPRHRESGLVVAYLATILVDSMVHGPLWIHMEAYFFFSMLALIGARMSPLADLTAPQRP